MNRKRIIFEDVLVAFNTVFERLKRATPGAQNKLNLINHIIMDDVSKIPGVSKVITRGRSVEIIYHESADCSPALFKSKIDEIVANAIEEVIL